jgi:hypothetical protein
VIRRRRAAHGLAAGFMAALVGVLGFSTPAFAQADLVSRETVSGLLDLRLAAVSGENAWTNGGFGKARFDGAGSGFKGKATGQGDLVWKPRLSWEWSGLVDLQAQPDQTHGLDVGEAFIRYKPVPRGDTRFNIRAGLFYPPISLEHEGGAWVPADTITPSAINSWVGEELKVAGVEATITHEMLGEEIAATAAVFYDADTAGTLLALRGWSFGDVKSSLSGHFPLPPLSPFIAGLQPPFTTSVREIDDKPGWYGQLAWRRHGLALDVLYYDNGGDRVSKTAALEWAWDTRFVEAGLTWDIDPRTKLRAQAMHGTTHMGFPTPEIWIDNGYDAAYAMLTRQVAGGAVSLRVDAFDVTDHSWKTIDPNAEHGWALAAAWRRPLCPQMDLMLEAMQIDSVRAAREFSHTDPRQSQTVLQSSLRLKF